jgi:hypothetical protein
MTKETDLTVFSGSKDVMPVPFEKTDEANAHERRSEKAFFAYLAAFFAVALSAALFARSAFDGAVPADVFDVGSAYDAALSAGRLFFAPLLLFFAAFVFAFSPFSLPVSLCSLALYSYKAGARFFALFSAGGARNVCAACCMALSAFVFVFFAARSCALSPQARTVCFSSSSGRREAASLTLSFFTLSGAAALFIAACALILHFG